jgi:hypothetical protein
MSDKDTTTATYLDLTNKTYGLFVEAFAAANRRSLDYYKSAWEIISRPYASTAIETAARENFDRANQVLALTVSELQANGQQVAELTEKVLAQGAAWQETATHGFRGLVDSGISNVNYVKEAATQQFDDIAKRLDDVRTTASSKN